MTVKPAMCQSPPNVDKAVVMSRNQSSLGDSAAYTCQMGYHWTSGDSTLICILTEDYEAIWNGNTIVCSKGSKVKVESSY